MPKKSAIESHALVILDHSCGQLHQQDHLRNLLYTQLSKQFPYLGMDLIFTQDSVWCNIL